MMHTSKSNQHNNLESMLGWPCDYSSKSLLQITIDSRFISISKESCSLILSLTHIHFFLFSSNGSTRFMDSLLSLLPK